MAMRPKNRGFSRKVFDILEKNGPMNRSAITEEMKKIGHPVTSKQIITCLQNMRHRNWIEYSREDRRKFDIRSDLLKTQRNAQSQMLNESGKVKIAPFSSTRSVSPRLAVKTSKTVQSRPITASKIALPLQVVGMVLLTGIVTAVSTALAIRMF